MQLLMLHRVTDYTHTGQVKSFPPPTVKSLCFTTICEGFRQGKEDHYYSLSIRNTIVAAIVLAWLPMLFGVAAIFVAKKVHYTSIHTHTHVHVQCPNMCHFVHDGYHNKTETRMSPYRNSRPCICTTRSKC